MRVGIMGGTLDPVHNGHIQIAKYAKEELGLDRVMLLPAGDPPHKSFPTDKYDRLEMVRRACAGLDWIFPCGIEVQRTGTTYTVDTLEYLIHNNPDTQWYYLVGADTLNVLQSWRSFERVAKMCVFAAVGRAENPVSVEKIEYLKKEFGARIECLQFRGPDISSTEIRTKTAEGKDISGLVPEGVKEYIQRSGLYLSPYPGSKILEMLQESLKPSRYEHTLGVVRTAERLCERYSIPRGEAVMAAMLHDCAKSLPAEEAYLLACGFRDADFLELSQEPVLHAPAGAAIAKNVYGVVNPRILSAIRKHTLGDAEMSPLDALIFLADFIEPGRKPFAGLEEVRALAETDLYGAMCRCARLTEIYLAAQGKTSHPKTLKMLERYENRYPEK